MADRLQKLFPYEFEELLNALRRDLRTERELAGTDVAWSEWHEANTRMVHRLLEVLNPKRKMPANEGRMYLERLTYR
jgi:hypothetical protein